MWVYDKIDFLNIIKLQFQNNILIIYLYKKMKELKERQRQQNKQKAIKLGLDPE